MPHATSTVITSGTAIDAATAGAAPEVPLPRVTWSFWPLVQWDPTRHEKYNVPVAEEEIVYETGEVEPRSVAWVKLHDAKSAEEAMSSTLWLPVQLNRRVSPARVVMAWSELEE